MSEVFDSFSTVSDSLFCQLTEPSSLTNTLRPEFAKTNLMNQSLTAMKDIQNSIPDFYLEPQEEGGFVAFSREYSGAVGQGETIEEAITDIQKAIELLKEVISEDQT